LPGHSRGPDGIRRSPRRARHEPPRPSNARYPCGGVTMQPVFNQEKANDLIREFLQLKQHVAHLEKRLDKCGNVLRAVFELVQAELHIEPAALAEKLAVVVREKAAQLQAHCETCNRPLGGKKKCIYCGTER